MINFNTIDLLDDIQGGFVFTKDGLLFGCCDKSKWNKVKGEIFCEDISESDPLKPIMDTLRELVQSFDMIMSEKQFDSEIAIDIFDRIVELSEDIVICSSDDCNNPSHDYNNPVIEIKDKKIKFLDKIKKLFSCK